MKRVDAIRAELVHVPCARCERQSAFLGEAGLCPSCRTADLEREFGLQPGLLRELATLANGTIDRASGRRKHRLPLLRHTRTARGRAAVVA